MKTSLLPLLLLLACSGAQATSCVVTVGEKAHVRQSFDAATHVFSAYVEGMRTGPLRGRDIRLADLRVLQVWKGDLKPGALVSATAEESVHFVSDAFVPEEKSGILVYASGEPPFMIHTCSRSRRLDRGTRDIPLLNKLSGKPDYKLGR